jgi:hypothetical protein
MATHAVNWLSNLREVGGVRGQALLFGEEGLKGGGRRVAVSNVPELHHGPDGVLGGEDFGEGCVGDRVTSGLLEGAVGYKNSGETRWRSG